MRTATLLSATILAGMAFFCIWLIPDHVQLHVYCSGCDESVVGDVSLSNNAEFGRGCHHRVGTGVLNDSHGCLGLHGWKSADKRVAENPLDDNSPLADTTCHYLANATTPLPLIVAFDWAGMVTVDEVGIHNGGSGRAFYLWFYGAKVRLSHWDRPGRQVIYE